VPRSRRGIRHRRRDRSGARRRSRRRRACSPRVRRRGRRTGTLGVGVRRDPLAATSATRPRGREPRRGAWPCSASQGHTRAQRRRSRPPGPVQASGQACPERNEDRYRCAPSERSMPLLGGNLIGRVGTARGCRLPAIRRRGADPATRPGSRSSQDDALVAARRNAPHRVADRAGHTAFGPGPPELARDRCTPRTRPAPLITDSRTSSTSSTDRALPAVPSSPGAPARSPPAPYDRRTAQCLAGFHLLAAGPRPLGLMLRCWCYGRYRFISVYPEAIKIV
jgi:hypothetical protein